MNAVPSPEYDARLRDILTGGDWAGLREFARTENQVPDEIYDKDDHFWEVLLHKLICSRLDTLGLHGSSRAWLSERGYSTDLGGY
ncbi:MAG TPA: hypothetical protein VMS32_03820 [Verrucomicrobiae bacterium]|jgi:hypothetical protein|nr:hypothetical protein [Verrucomicrobiae bacterium]